MACGDVTPNTLYLPTCGLNAVQITKSATPPDGSLILPGDALSWTFQIESGADGPPGVSFEDIFDDCTYLESVAVSPGWTLTVDPFNPCRYTIENPTAVNTGVHVCVMTAVAGDSSGPVPVGAGTLRNTANALTPSPAPGNATELTFGPLMLGDIPDQTVGVYVAYYYDIVSGAAPFVVSLLAGVIPTGLVLNSTGVLVGIPTVADVFDFTLRLTDNNGNTFDLSDGCMVS